MQQIRRRRTWVMITLVFALVLSGLPTSTKVSNAQVRIAYFSQTGHYLRGAFLAFWERRGGVSIFGLPITEEYIRRSDGKLVQYFERARFELRGVGNNQAVVELGLIGAENLRARGLGFPRIAPFRSTSAQRYFPETGHSLRGAFKTFWERRGGLEIFGYPLSEETPELLADGVQRTVQYFERARFELHGSTVRLGLLGSDLAPCQLRPGLPPNAAPPNPLPEGDSSACARIPNAVANGRVYPDVSAPGTTLGFEARNYLPNELISIWLNLPNGTTRALPYQAVANADGGVLIGFRTLETDPVGQWSLVGQGTRSGRVVLIGFRLQY
ncbi:MAG: hypothetical protein MI924_23350 [Chloroflexales bacterium]|nr:hypothetical protein [Chloroflexales bacterium]